MSDQDRDSPDQLRGNRVPEHAAAAARRSGTDRARMIAVIPEMIAGRYLPAIPADSEDRSRD